MYKVAKWIFVGLAAVLIIANVPLSEIFADHGGKQHERWERESKVRYGHFENVEHEDDGEREEDDWGDNEYANVAVTPIIPSDGADFTDGETVTLSFSDGVSVKAVIRVKNGQPLIPAQPVFDACRIPYVLYPKGSILEGFANGKQFIFHADKRVMYLGGQKKSMDIGAFTTSGQFYVPLKTAAEKLGYTFVTKPEDNRIAFR